MFEQDEKIRQRLLNAAEKLDLNDSETPRGKKQRAEVARELIRLVNEDTHLRVTRVPKVEQLRNREEIPDMIEEAIEAGQILYEEMKEKRQEVIEDYGVVVDSQREHGYYVEFDGRRYAINYPEEVIEVEKEDGGWVAPSDVEVPDKVRKFATAYWKAWEEMTGKMQDEMEEIGFEHQYTDEYYQTYRVGDFGPEIVVRGWFPRKPTRFSIKERTEDWWDLHQIWERFDNPADKNSSEAETVED